MFVLLVLMSIAAAAFGFFLAYDETNSLAMAIVAALAAMPLAMLLVMFMAAIILPRISG